MGDGSVAVLKVTAIADLPTQFGMFQIVAFSFPETVSHIAVVRGDVADREDVPTRVHSECLTGDAFGSLRCDCRSQLEQALRAIGEMERGIVLYLRQEGRGIGLQNKIRAYSLQDKGMDTVDANVAIGRGVDERDYGVAVSMLNALGARSIRLVTNNPDKLAQLRGYGLNITGRIPHVMIANPFNNAYLRTKATRLGHMYEDGDPRPPTSADALPDFEAEPPDTQEELFVAGQGTD